MDATQTPSTTQAPRPQAYRPEDRLSPAPRARREGRSSPRERVLAALAGAGRLGPTLFEIAEASGCSETIAMLTIRGLVRSGIVEAGRPRPVGGHRVAATYRLAGRDGERRRP